MIAPKLFRHIGEAKQSVAKSNIGSLENAVDIFNYDYDRSPSTLDELVSRPADIDETQWKPPSIKAKNLFDPWDRKFLYRLPGDYGVYDIYSLGKDGQEGGEGDNADMGNW